MLIMDMPETCYECPFLDEADNCLAMGVYYTDVEVVLEKPTWCPLREVLQKKEEEHRILKPYEDTPWHKRFVTEKDVEAIGYNACIDEILGGGEL